MIQSIDNAKLLCDYCYNATSMHIHTYVGMDCHVMAHLMQLIFSRITYMQLSAKEQ